MLEWRSNRLDGDVRYFREFNRGSLTGTVTGYLSVTSKPRFLHHVCGDAPPPEPVAGARVRSPSRPAISPLWPVSRLRHSADRQVSSGWWLVIWETGRGSWGLWWHATKAVSSLPLATARHKILGDLTETETLYFPLVSNPKSGMSLRTQFTATAAPSMPQTRFSAFFAFSRGNRNADTNA